jgi:hypothetical protein
MTMLFDYRYMTLLLVLIYRLLKLFSIFSEKTTILLLLNAICFHNETEGRWHKSGGHVGDAQRLRQLCFQQSGKALTIFFCQLSQINLVFYIFFSRKFLTINFS